MGRSLFGEVDNFVEFLELVSETYSFIVMPLSVMDFQYVQDLLLDKAGVVVDGEQQPAVEARIKECAKAFGFDSDQVFVSTFVRVITAGFTANSSKRWSTRRQVSFVISLSSSSLRTRQS